MRCVPEAALRHQHSMRFEPEAVATPCTRSAYAAFPRRHQSAFGAFYICRDMEEGKPQVPELLAGAAQRRRAVFPSKGAALASYAPRPPFNALHAESLALYVEHGFVTLPGIVRV